MSGVRKIEITKGSQKPKIGEPVYFGVKEWYPGTTGDLEALQKKVTWMLYLKDNGKFRPATGVERKKYPNNCFTFGKGAVGKTYKVEGYLHNPEGSDALPTIELTPIDEVYEEKRILKIKTDYSKKGPQYRVAVKVDCHNMAGDRLELYLIEKNKKTGEETIKDNNLNRQVLVDKQNKLYAHLSFYVIPFIQKAEDYTYFVRASHNGKTPVDFKQGEITKAYLTDHKGEELKSIKVGDYVSVAIESKNMVGRYVRYQIKEKDSVRWSDDNIFISEPIKVTEDKMLIEWGFVTQEIFNKGIDNNKTWLFDPDRTKQEYFLNVQPVSLEEYSEPYTIIEENVPEFENPRSPVIVSRGDGVVEENNHCGEKFCIKKGDKSELIREVNIRLAGFGGNVPTDEFTDRTEKMIKQFQRDYMKVTETGKICGDVLKAIDDFGSKFPVDVNEGKCPCKECKGFGNGLNSNERGDSKILERSRKYEYPGIHRTLLWVEKAIKFYLANQEKSKKLRVGLIYSGYRCNANNKQKGRTSTNHMGKALDLHIYGLSNTSNTETTANEVRDLLVKYTKAEYRWKGKNVIALEPSTRNRIGKEFIATTWVHYDVRTFELEYLKDEYFVKDNNSVNGEPIMQLALKLGYSHTCNCLPSGDLSVNKEKEKDGRVDPKTLKASDEIVEFIKDWEKYRKMPYNDSKNFCTIGYGHLIKKKKCEDIVIPTEFKNGISKAEATQLFKEDLKEFEVAVQRDVTVKLHQREFDALVDLLFNCGQYFLSSGKAPNLYKNLLDENYDDAAKEFLDIENRTRRKQNYEIFKNGNYDSRH